MTDTHKEVAKLEKMLDIRLEKLEGNIKVLHMKIIMFMWFITIGMILFEIIHCLTNVMGK